WSGYWFFAFFFFFSSRRRHTRFSRDWSSDVCSSDLAGQRAGERGPIDDGHVPLTELDADVPLDPWERVVLPDREDHCITRDHDRSEERRVGKERRSRW